VTFRAVVFDVDGTLVDSERDGHRVAFNEAFAEAGLPDRWDVPTYVRLLEVSGGRQRLAAWFREQGRGEDECEALAERLHEAKTRIMRSLALLGRIPPRPGVLALLRDLTRHGVSLHIATTGSRAWVEPLLRTSFGPIWDVVVTGTEVTDLKPSPQVYLEVLRRTSLDQADLVAVEDSAQGVAAAVAAGLACVAVRNQDTRHHDLSAARLVGAGPDDPAVVDWLLAHTATRAPR